MCIVPQRQVLIPPTAKASAIASYMRVVLLCHLLYAVLNFLTLNWVQGVFDLLGALIGFMAIRTKEGYSYQPVLCYCMFCAIRFIITLIYAGISFAKSDLGTDSGLARWQFWLIVVQYALAPFIFASGACLAWLLFQELKKVIEEMAQGLGGDDSGGGMFSGASAPSRAASNQTPLLGGGGMSGVSGGGPGGGGGGGGGGVVSPPVVEPPSGFRPFAGQGHRLGGT